MSYNWGPHFIVPTGVLESYSGIVQLRERLDDDLLAKELEALGLSGPLVKVSNPWYYRAKGSDTWIKIGESTDKASNFPVKWDTRNLPNGKYEVLGLMHVFVRKGTVENAIARQSVVEVAVKN
ncbi:MAG: hypothetical protein AB1597_05795 [Chloroflexota bacterium]